MSEKDPRYYQAIKDHLARHDIVRSAEEITDANFGECILEFQNRKRLYADGVVGPLTLWALQEPFARDDTALRFRRVKVDKDLAAGDSVPCSLREDAAAAFERLAERVRSKGGRVTSAGGRRALDAEVTAERSATSFHYPGLAFDLHTRSAMADAERNAYVCEFHPDTRRWTVWARAEGGDVRTVRATFTSGPDRNVKVEERDVTGPFLNFTALAAEEGFQSIRALSSFCRETNKRYMGSEWWHFQYEAALTPNFSQFGIELLKVQGYRSFWTEGRPRHVWECRKYVFKENWN